MSSQIDKDFLIPHQIAQYIVSLVPQRDRTHGNDRQWAEHEKFFERGPNALLDQMQQGIVLEVARYNHKPQALHTKYGRWIVFNVSNGSFLSTFKKLQDTLRLSLVEYRHQSLSFWQVRHWNGAGLPEPIRAKREHYFHWRHVEKIFHAFKTSLSLQKTQQQQKPLASPIKRIVPARPQPVPEAPPVTPSTEEETPGVTPEEIDVLLNSISTLLDKPIEEALPATPSTEEETPDDSPEEIDGLLNSISEDSQVPEALPAATSSTFDPVVQQAKSQPQQYPAWNPWLYQSRFMNASIP